MYSKYSAHISLHLVKYLLEDYRYANRSIQDGLVIGSHMLLSQLGYSPCVKQNEPAPAAGIITMSYLMQLYSDMTLRKSEGGNKVTLKELLEIWHQKFETTQELDEVRKTVYETMVADNRVYYLKSSTTCGTYHTLLRELALKYPDNGVYLRRLSCSELIDEINILIDAHLAKTKVMTQGLLARNTKALVQTYKLGVLEERVIALIAVLISHGGIGIDNVNYPHSSMTTTVRKVIENVWGETYTRRRITDVVKRMGLLVTGEQNDKYLPCELQCGGWSNAPTHLYTRPKSGVSSNGGSFLRELINYKTPAFTQELRRRGGIAHTTELKKENFKHIEEFDTIAHLLKNAIKRKAVGVNILIHGIPGTGKTELAIVLGETIGYLGYFAGEKAVSLEDSIKGNTVDDDGDINSYHRVTDLEHATLQRKNSRDGFVVVDEAEEILCDSNIARIAHLRGLETNPIPRVWITNYAERVDSAIIRRMSFILSVPTPDKDVRMDITRYALKKKGVTLDDTLLGNMIDRYQPSVSNLVDAVKTARIIDPRLSKFETILASVTSFGSRKTSNDDKKKQEEKTLSFLKTYDASLSNTDIDTTSLVSRLKEKKITNFSLCMFGPSGTGKSALARYIATELGYDILFKPASEILDMYVGGSEKKIAEAFEEAERENKVLCFDEADSLLSDRTHAVRSWEISQVNQMLTCMETALIPFICTTNLMSNIDAAAMRRFTFKIKFDFLAYDQLKAVFQLYYGIPPSDRILSMRNLTPGDIYLTHKKLSIMKSLDDMGAIEEALMIESEAKPEKSGSPIGFNR